MSCGGHSLTKSWTDVDVVAARTAVVQNPEQDPLVLVATQVALAAPGPDREDVRALVIQELRRLHEGVLARYGLLPSELARWRSVQG